MEKQALIELVTTYLDLLDPDDISRDQVEDILFDALNQAEKRLIL